MRLRLLLLAAVLWPGVAAAADAVLRRAIAAEPGTLDPQSGESVYQLRIDADLFEGLTAIAPGGAVVPGQAESWAVSPDGLVWRFELRPGLAWSNGDALTAQAFVYSFRRLVDPANAFRGAFLAESIRNAKPLIGRKAADPAVLGVAAPDPLTVEITLDAPNSALPELLALLPPVNRAAVESAGRDAFKPEHFVGNGAYRLTEWRPHDRLVMERNPHYHAPAAIGRVEYYPIEDQAEAYKRYRAGDLDLTDGVPEDQLDEIRRDLAGEYKTSPAFGLVYLGFNLSRAPFKDNPKLRAALTLAIDRSALVDKILHGNAVPADGWVPRGLDLYRNAAILGAGTSQDAREAAARQAYAEAGYSAEHPLDLELAYNTSDSNKRLMIAVAAMWQKVLGVRTSLRNMELRAFLDLRQKHAETEAFRAGFAAPYQDPLPLLELLRSGSVYNDMVYANPEFDALLAKAAAAPDKPARLAGLAAAEAIGLADFPAAPLYFLVDARLVKPYVAGWQPSPRDTFRSQDLLIAAH
jgi:oligopeptide transport system substrate-binding protein